MEITPLHSGIGVFNGTLYFLLNERLLTIEVGTPNFNDYNEFRFRELMLSPEKYKPEENTIEIEPFDFKPFTIDQKELEYLERWFSNNEIGEDEDISDSPYHYLDADTLMTSVNFVSGYKHMIHNPSDWCEKSNYFIFKDENWKLSSELTNTPRLYESGGMQRLLVHISEAAFKHFYGKA